MHRANWDDLRYVLAVSTTGSLSGAARQLGVNHATVLRHVTAFEDAHGGPVFERTAQGYELLSDRARVIDAAREVANAMHSVERLMQGAIAPLRGVVRVSSTDSFCQFMLPPLAALLHAEFSDLRIELLSSNNHLDFSRLQADISVRPAMQLSEDMFGEVAAHLGFAIYAAPEMPETWLGTSGALSRSAAAAWLSEEVTPEQIVASADSFVVLSELARRGIGRTLLPCFLGDADPRLVRLSKVAPELQVPIWVASHSDLADVPRLRAVRARISAHLDARSAQLSGEGA